MTPVSKFHEYLQRQGGVPPNPVADAAVALGLPVFPCGANKQPLTGHGFKDASTDEATIRAMFAQSGAVLIGVPTGRASGWAVIDVDVKDGARGQEWLDANSDRLPSTRTHATRSGGWHLIFRMPDAELRNSASRIAPGVDVRAEGGYVIVPPSEGYHLVPEGPEPQDMPAWLLTVAMPPVVATSKPHAPRITDHGGTPYGLAALDRECGAIRRAPDGAKHDTLNKAAYSIGGLVAAGELQESAAFAALSSALADIRSSCRDFRAAEKTLRNSFDDGKGKPRAVPEREPVAEIHPAAALIAKMHAKAGKQASKPLAVPPGLMDVDGVLAMLVDECNRTAIRPQPFLALGAAICAIGALAGRQYRTATDLRTNIYIAALAESGGGKDHAAEIVRRAMDDAGLDRYLGGETLASGRAVLSSLENHPAKLFQVDEFGLFLSGVTGKKAAPHKAEIWSELMKLYSRAKGVYRGTEYANKKENPRVDIHQPCVSFYGTSTPVTFWAALAGGAMSDGSLARFLLFISDNNRPDRNRGAGIFKASPELVEALQAVARGPGPTPAPGNLPALHVAPMTATQAVDPYVVQMTVRASELHDRKLDEEDVWARKVEGTPKAAIVNRLGENAAKLALISAISRTPTAPSISEHDIAWGWALAEHCTKSLLQDSDRFIADTDFEARLNKALNILRKHGPCTQRDMFLRGFKVSERERDEVLRALVNNGMVIVTDHPAGPKGGRPTQRYAVTGITTDDNGTADDGVS
jgi:hypothetical protein